MHEQPPLCDTYLTSGQSGALELLVSQYFKSAKCTVSLLFNAPACMASGKSNLCDDFGCLMVGAVIGGR